MANIQVSFIGSPQARASVGLVSLRSRQTWGLLASLLLEPQTVDRGVLAARFWPDGRDDRNSLTMALASLKAAFGANTVITNRNTVRLDRTYFVTDLDRLDAMLSEARDADSTFLRKTILTGAATLLRGRFLEGADHGSDVDGFFDRARTRCEQVGADVLLALSAAQRDCGDANAAFDTLLRASQYIPENAVIAHALLRVAEQTGKQDVARRRLHEIGMKDIATERLQKPLSPHLQSILASLSVFAVPFSEQWACAICRDASAETLTELLAAGMLQRADEVDTYRFPQGVRDRLWNAQERETRRAAECSYFRTANDWVAQRFDDVSHLSSTERRKRWKDNIAHFSAVIHIIIRRNPTLDRVRFIQATFQHGFYEEAQLGRVWLESALQNPDLPLQLQTEAAHLLARINQHIGGFDDAVHWFSHYLALSPTPEARVDRIHSLGELAVTLHHKGDYENAIHFAREALRQSELLPNQSLLAHVLFVWAEVGYSNGYLSESLDASHKCVVLRETIGNPNALAPALYQNGVIRYASGDLPGALHMWNRCVTVFLEVGEENGVADCLRMMATVRFEQGALGEATLHAVQARAIYERLSIAGSRAGILEVLGYIKQAQNDTAAARALYAESLAYWESVEHPRWIPRLQKRLATLGDISAT